MLCSDVCIVAILTLHDVEFNQTNPSLWLHFSQPNIAPAFRILSESFYGNEKKGSIPLYFGGLILS